MLMAGSALKRLMAEYKRKKNSVWLQQKPRLIPAELTQNPPEGIVAGVNNWPFWNSALQYYGVASS